MDFFHRFRSNTRDVCTQPITNSTSNSSQSAFIWRVHFRIQSTNSKVKNTLHLTNRFHLVVHVYSDNPPMASKRDANKILMMFSPRFDVFCASSVPNEIPSRHWLFICLLFVCLLNGRLVYLFLNDLLSIAGCSKRTKQQGRVQEQHPTDSRATSLQTQHLETQLWNHPNPTRYLAHSLGHFASRRRDAHARRRVEAKTCVGIPGRSRGAKLVGRHDERIAGEARRWNIQPRSRWS